MLQVMCYDPLGQQHMPDPNTKFPNQVANIQREGHQVPTPRDHIWSTKWTKLRYYNVLYVNYIVFKGMVHEATRMGKGY